MYSDDNLKIRQGRAASSDKMTWKDLLLVELLYLLWVHLYWNQRLRSIVKASLQFLHCILHVVPVD